MVIEGWEKRLAKYLIERKNMPFEWGFNDCILFFAKGHEVITGNDYYSKYLPYSTEEEAQEILAREGGFHGIISKDLGQPHQNYLSAKRGEAVLISQPRMMMGIVDDTGQFIACPGVSGTVKVPLRNASLIWSL